MNRDKRFYRIAVIGGDGVGPEVTEAACQVLSHIASLDERLVFDFVHLPWGCQHYLETGRMMDPGGLDYLRGFDAILLGSVGYPSVPDHLSLRDLLLAIRQGFDQYVNLRPVKLLEGAPCPLLGIRPQDVDMVFVRENTEGEYAGLGRTEADRAEQVAVFTEKGCKRVMRYAFDLAARQGRSLTSISKANALNHSMVFWDRMFEEVAEEYPAVETRHLLVDAAAMFMVRDPGRFDVVVCSNLFGDILTDLGAAIAGGMGLAAGANLNPERYYPSMFEPVHGSGIDLAGSGRANPLATFWAASQMLDHLGQEAWGGRLLKAVEGVLTKGEVRTPDLGGRSTTQEVSQAVQAELKSLSEVEA